MITFATIFAILAVMFALFAIYVIWYFHHNVRCPDPIAHWQIKDPE